MENNKSPLISIITVSFNCAKTIEETILSVINQSYTSIEYIIIDGKSTDGTIEIIKKYADRISFWVSEKDDGIYDAMNKGLRKANGDFVLFLGGDDHLISFHVLQDIVPQLQPKRVCVYHGDVYRCVSKDLYGGKYNRYKLAIKNIPHQALFYPKVIYKNYNYDVKYSLFADYQYNIMLFSKIPFEYLNQTITWFNDAGSCVKHRDICWDMDRKHIITTFLGYVPYYFAQFYHLLRKVVKND